MHRSPGCIERLCCQGWCALARMEDRRDADAEGKNELAALTGASRLYNSLLRPPAYLEQARTESRTGRCGPESAAVCDEGALVLCSLGLLKA